MRLLRICRYRRKTILLTLYCFILTGAIYYVVAPRYYQSSAKLLISEQRLDQVSAMGDHERTVKTMETHRGIVASPVVINDAIQRIPSQYRVDLQGVPPREWRKTISENLSASNTRKTNFIEVSYRSLHPEAATATVSAVIESYLEFVEKNHRGAAGEILAVLNDKSAQLEQELKEKRLQLQQFRQQVGYIAVSSEDGVIEPMIHRAMQLNESLMGLQAKRVKLQASLLSVEAAMKRGEDVSQQLMGVEETLGQQMLMAAMGMSPQDMRVLGDQQKQMLEAREQLQTLSTDYGPNHPRITELKNKVLMHEHFLRNYHTEAGHRYDSMGQSFPSNVVLGALRQSVQQALVQEKQMLDTFEVARREAASHSDALVQLRMLERDVDRKESEFDALAAQIDKIDLNQGRPPISATVVSEPVPNEIPVTPQLRLIALFSLVGGSITGALIAYMRDLFDDRFNSPEELSAQLGVPVLAMVRELSPLPGVGLDTVHTNTMPHAVETESFRTLRTALSLGANTCDRLLISSSEPGDGKTTVSANLSVAFAQAGKRTLVIDADLRRPGFTALVDLKGQPGVADVLSSDQSPEQIAPTLVQHTSVEGLDILPVGLRRPNPAELLSGKAFVELLAWADSQYDRVIVDCPPVLAVSDAQIVGQLVDGAILVVRPEKNHRRSVMRAVDSFHATGCQVLGVVANGLSEELAGYGYGYSYNDGYGHMTESEEELTPPVAPDPKTVPRHRETMQPPVQAPPVLTPPSLPPAPAIRPRRAA